MTKTRLTAQAAEMLEAKIRAAGSIGALELMAGIGPDHMERFAFWRQFDQLGARAIIPAGVAELKRRIRVQHAPAA